ncbi:MAG: alanine racemase [Bdellovibrionaceae bacterium]|nr:alanine racemase [Pseudobdellovibrionaceae bacterium]
MNFRHTFAEINISHLKHNLRQLRNLVPEGTFFCPMVKSYAYGHGDLQVVSALIEEGVTDVGVALLEEGVRLREAGFKKININVFGPFDLEGAKTLFKYELTPMISDFRQLRFLQQSILSEQQIEIHLKMNTGMNRLGFSSMEIPEIKQFLNEFPRIKLRGLCTHLSKGEDMGCEGSFSLKQLQEFEKITNQFPQNNLVTHVLNSSGLLGLFTLSQQEPWQRYWPVGVRPGIALYGVLPSFKSEKVNSEVIKKLKLKPVMCLKSEVIQVHELEPGESVSYGNEWVAQQKSVIGVMPVGYADGYTRHLSNKGVLILGGKKIPVIGIVCMDYTLVDLTKLLAQGIIKSSQEAVGKELTLFGESKTGDYYPVEELAKKAGTIAYELLACIGKRVPRQYLKEHQ